MSRVLFLWFARRELTYAGHLTPAAQLVLLDYWNKVAVFESPFSGNVNGTDLPASRSSISVRSLDSIRHLPISEVPLVKRTFASADETHIRVWGPAKLAGLASVTGATRLPHTTYRGLAVSLESTVSQ